MVTEYLDERDSILGKLANYKGVDADEEEMRQKLIVFVKSNVDCFKRTLLIGHITGSAWIVDADFAYVLLTHHMKLDKWFQLGGHSDGDPDTLAVATREAWEESGLKSLKLVSEEIFDVDIHTIPEKNDEPEHKHYDIRFLFTANRQEPLRVSSESKDLQWVAIDEVESLNPDKALLRMVDKTKKLK